MRAGRLKNRVSLQAPSTVKSSTGHPTKTFTTITKGTVWAAIEVIRGKESETADELSVKITTKILIRDSGDVSMVDETYRVLFGTRIFSIETVIPPTDRSGSSAYIEMMCVEGKKDGG